jgi:hypothetical protein
MTYLERYQAGDHVAVWNELMALGDGVRHEPYYADAAAVAAETMRRARHNVELLIRRLDARGYRFLDTVSSAEDRLSRLDVMGQLSAQIEARGAQVPGRYNVHATQMLEGLRAMKAKVAPLLEKAAAEAAKAAAAKRKPPLEDSQVFSPPDKKTPRLLAKLEKAAGGPLPLSLHAWYEQVGGVSLMGSDPRLNTVDFSNRNVLQQFETLTAQHMAPIPPAGEEYAPDPLVIFPLEELLDQTSDREGGKGVDGHELQLVISPDDLHKANVSGDAYYITLPDARADFPFDDWHNSTFVNYLRVTFQWGGFPGWERSKNPPRKEIAELAEGLLPL